MATRSEASSKTTSTQRMIKSLDYKTVLSIIQSVEERLHFYCENFDMINNMSKKSIKVEADFKRVLQAAESERKLKKYYAMKEKEKLESEAKYIANLEKMAKKEAVKPIPGKKKMVRVEAPAHDHYIE